MITESFIKKYLSGSLPVLVAIGCFYFYLGGDFTYFQDDDPYVSYSLAFGRQEFFHVIKSSYFPFGYAFCLSVLKNIFDFLGVTIPIVNIAKLLGMISATTMSLLIYHYILEKTKSYSYSVLSTLLIITPSSWFLHVYGGVNSEQLYFPFYFICFFIAVKQKGKVGPIWSLCFGLLALIRHMHIAFLPLILFTENTSYKKRFYNFLISISPAVFIHFIYFMSGNPSRKILFREFEYIYPALFTTLYGFFDIWGELFQFYYYNLIINFYVILFIIIFLVYRKSKINFERKWAIITIFFFIFIIIFTNQFLDHGVHFGVRLILFPMMICLPVFFVDLYSFSRLKFITHTIFLCVSFLSLYSFYLHSEDLGPLFLEKKFHPSDVSGLVELLYEKSDQKVLLTNYPGLMEDLFKVKATSVFLRKRFTSMRRLNKDGITKLPKELYGIFFFQRNGLEQFDLFNDFKKLNQCDVRFSYVPELVDHGSDLYRIIVKFKLNEERWKLYNECLNTRK